MTYYEEFGLTRQATIEEVRRSYRNLSRLLHPDQCPDPELRGTAENQMRRLNQVYETLSDPVRRRLYDEGLDPPRTMERPHPRRDWRGPVKRALWVFAGAAGVSAISWYVTGERIRVGPVPAPEVREEPAAEALPGETRRVGLAARKSMAAGVAEARRIERLENQIGVLRAERDAAVQRASRLAADLAGQRERAHGAEPASAVPASASPAAPLARKTPARTFSGRWFYVPALDEKQPQALTYAPEFIEAIISQEGGRLRGRYRARYQVGDRAISPNVSFQFEGDAEGESARLPWKGPGGARGEISLRLVGESRVDVHWTAALLGQELGLAAGTGVLVRQPD